MPPEYHATPLCAAVQCGYCRIVEMLLHHEDGDKYLQPNDEWETTIARAFDSWKVSPALDILIEHAMMSERNFLLFTLQKLIKYGVDGFRGNTEALVALLKRFPSAVQTLALGCYTTALIKIVKDCDEHYGLEDYLKAASYFCSAERLRPYLLSALHLARQLRYDYCEDTLRKALDGTLDVSE